MSVGRPVAGEPLRRLLQRLGPSEDAAGDAYEALRRLLCRYFEVRAAVDAEGLADQVLDRVARRLCDGVDIGEVAAYARGVARLVLLESRRHATTDPLPSDPPMPDGGVDADDDAAAACLDGCLRRLEPTTQAHVMAYYSAEGRGRIDGRKRLAAELGVSATALRLRMLRLRLSLEHCVRACLRGAGTRNSLPAGSTDR